MSAPAQPPIPTRKHFIITALYYLFVLLTILVLHGRSSFATPSFIYQGF